MSRYGVLLLTASAHMSAAEAVPEANPARPTVSTPATLTPVGYLQFENGGLLGNTSPEFSTRLGFNQVTKLTVNPRLQLLLLSEPMVISRDRTEPREHQPGEVFVGAQGVVVTGERHRPTVALSYIRRVYVSPAPELDLGTFHQGITVLFSGDLGGFHYDTNAIFNEQTESGTRRGQFGQTLSVSHRAGRATISGELWHFTQPYFNSYAIGNLWAVSYPLRPNLVIDAGFQHGFTATSTKWEGFVGFTYLLPRRLW
jgi:hypothetical protein